MRFPGNNTISVWLTALGLLGAGILVIFPTLTVIGWGMIALAGAGATAMATRHIIDLFKYLRIGKIEIRFEHRTPYEVTDIQNRNVLIAARIGVKNSGKSPLSNCCVFIEKISPEPSVPLRGFLPILLEDRDFIVRPDDEKLVEIASHNAAAGKYRFSAPFLWGAHAEILNQIEDNISLTIVIKVVAIECQRSATFKIRTDSSKALHLEYIGYVD